MANRKNKTLMDRVRTDLAHVLFVQKSKVILSGVNRDRNLGRVVADYFETTIRDYPDEGLILLREGKSGYRMYQFIPENVPRSFGLPEALKSSGFKPESYTFHGSVKECSSRLVAMFELGIFLDQQIAVHYIKNNGVFAVLPYQRSF